ncbi:MAG: hypothetical protein IPJ23_03970 [Ignavibacteriales bacterium]|nr:hypothetical protein [Ignavibacteriales bacterium]
MCGIFGVINTKDKIDEGRVLAARDILAHRGPDDKGIYISKDANVALAHLRLSIIDLSPSAHQPMTTQDGRYTIVYNGEIYNYKELSKQLIVNSKQSNESNSLLITDHSSPITDHSSLLSNSDTEVILKLYIKYGKDCLNMLRGMFAFAIWDDKEKTLLLRGTALASNLFII